MRFGEKSVTDQVTYSIYGTNLLFVDSYKDLGITIDSGLKFHTHIKVVIGKFGAMINNLLRYYMSYHRIYVNFVCFTYSSNN